jgi:hypothetical protein
MDGASDGSESNWMSDGCCKLLIREQLKEGRMVQAMDQERWISVQVKGRWMVQAMDVGALRCYGCSKRLIRMESYERWIWEQALDQERSYGHTRDQAIDQ